MGPNSTDEWLQVGISATEGQGPSLYYEVAQPNHAPRYVMLKSHVPIGKTFDVAVLETQAHPGSWQVWVNGTAVTDRIFLPGSHGAWRPTATAESWNGDSAGTCNRYDVPVRTGPRRDEARRRVAADDGRQRAVGSRLSPAPATGRAARNGRRLTLDARAVRPRPENLVRAGQ